MPNGGSDCCGTCWFKAERKLKATDKLANGKEYITFCTIRDLDIPSPFWTYCANHPHHTNGQKVDLPLGPVYVDSGEYPYSRKIWKKAIDTNEVRLRLVELINDISNAKEHTYPAGIGIEEEALKQVGLLKEKGAVNALLRIIDFDIEDFRQQPPPMIKNKSITVGLAIEALLKITGCEHIDKLAHFIDKGIDKIPKEKYRRVKDNFAVIRYHLVRGLEYCFSYKASDLLEKALSDWHKEIAAFAQEITERKEAKMRKLYEVSEQIADKVLIKYMDELKNGGNNSLTKSSMEHPFVLPKDALDFVQLEHKLIDLNCIENYFDCNRIGQTLKYSDNKIYDIIEIEYKNSPKDKRYTNKLIYFDITECYKNKYGN